MSDAVRVHWYEGMFLLPSQMQAAERFGLRQLHLSHKWDLHYDWGLRAIELDLGALANFRCSVRALKARLRDGTLVSVPEDGSLGAVDLKPAFQRASSVTVYLALPQLRLGRSNVGDAAAPPSPAAASPAAGDPGDDGQPRYQLASEEIEDENASDNPQEVPVRLLNFKLLLSTDDHSGFDVLPIARVERSGAAEAPPQLDRSYIPPLLACDAWPVLAADILQAVYHRVGKKLDQLANLVVSRGITFDSRAGEDPVLFNQLHVLNEAYALFGTLAFAEGIHPLPAYLELCRLVGQLAIFGPNRKTPELPRYDHDDLGGCFYRVKQYLDDRGQEELKYQERPFEGQGLRMQVALEAAWLEAAWEMYVGVESPLPSEKCVRLLTKPGQLDMKIGSAQKVDEIFEQGRAGLKFMHTAAPPRALPVRADLIYFQVVRESQQQEWLNVQKTLTLAIRLNQHRVVGNIQGQRTLTVKTETQPTTMRFTLFLIPREG
jgi:type VI secretion system protein ImpJ